MTKEMGIELGFLISMPRLKLPFLVYGGLHRSSGETSTYEGHIFRRLWDALRKAKPKQLEGQKYSQSERDFFPRVPWNPKTWK